MHDEASPPTPSESPRRRGRILLVDDDEALRRAYGIVLRRSGFLVDEADSGRGASEQLARARFDMIISDIGLPDTTGLELLRAVRLLDAEVPVVLMTGAADLPTAIEAVEVGALHYLLKPVARGAAQPGAPVRRGGADRPPPRGRPGDPRERCAHALDGRAPRAGIRERSSA